MDNREKLVGIAVAAVSSFVAYRYGALAPVIAAVAVGTGYVAVLTFDEFRYDKPGTSPSLFES